MEAFQPSIDQKVLSYSELRVDGDELGTNTKVGAGFPWVPDDGCAIDKYIPCIRYDVPTFEQLVKGEGKVSLQGILTNYIEGCRFPSPIRTK